MYRLDFKSLISILRKYDDVLITFHSYGDRDAVSSAFALSKLFRIYSIKTPDYITKNTRLMLDMAHIEYNIATIEKVNEKAIIILDTNDFDSLGRARDIILKSNKPIIFIDHHLFNNKPYDAYIFDDESYNSTASIVYELLKSMHISIDKKTAILLLNGIISDSAELRNSTPETFTQIGELLEIAKTGYYNIRKLMSHEESAEARSWAIKDLLGANVFIKEGLLFVFGKAHAHANLSADNAIRLGADVAIFYAENESEVSFSARLNIDLDRRYNIHLGKVMRQLAPIIKGNGGGHPAAAGAYGPLKQASQEFLERFFEECIKKVQNERRQQMKTHDKTN